MMNKKKVYIILTVILLCLVVIIIQSNFKLDFDNSTSKEILLTTHYSKKDIKEISKKIDIIEKKHKIYFVKRSRCIRSYKNGGYAIYLQENGDEYYAFFDEKRRLFAETSIVEFLDSDKLLKFEGCTSNETNGMLKFGGYMRFPYSASREVGILFLKDGVAQITFDKPSFFKDAKIIEIKILSDEEYMQTDFSWKPYILPIDRE